MKPRISVVIPTYRRPELLTRCIEALAVQTLPVSDYDILVCDDAAEGSTARLVAELGWRFDLEHTLHYVAVRGRHGPAAARNLGWRTARADVIAFTDDDTVPTSDWLEAGLCALAPGVAAVGGRIRMPLGHPPTDYERDARGLERAEFATANCFVRREALVAVGGFDERFRLAWREDSDLQFSLLAAGFAVTDAPNAVVVHPIRPAPFGVSVRQQRKVFYDALLYKKHRLLYRRRINPHWQWRYLATSAALLALFAGIALHLAGVVVVAGVSWGTLTAAFLVRRLKGTVKSARHVAEMLLTTLIIPPLALFWRYAGAIRFRVLFL